jgi:hypothetical protein
MSTENLPRLARKVKASGLGLNGNAVISHDHYSDETAELPAPLREEVAGFVQDLRARIPTDFTFLVGFEFAGVRLTIEYADGNVTSTAGGGFFTSRKSMLRQLRRIDWGNRRTEILKQTSLFDDLVDEASDRPVCIPSSEVAAIKWAAWLTEVIGLVQKMQPLPAFSLIVARDDAGLGPEHFETRGEVVFTIADRMTTHCDIVGVLEGGIPWSFSEIEAAKLEAVEQLGPISRAKAEGRFRLHLEKDTGNDY